MTGPTHRRDVAGAAFALLAVLAVAVAPTLPTATAAAVGPGGIHAVAGVPGLDAGFALSGSAVQRVIVTGGQRVTDAVRLVGGLVTADLPFVDGVAADVRADMLAELASTPGVTAVTADREATYEEYAYDDTTTASNFTRTSQATKAWVEGNYGKGVGVAVIDTGVSPMPDLAGRIVHGPDLSGEGTTVDSYGHGTVMAGIIAGDGADSATRDGGAFTGVAPSAHVVSVKTAGRNGAVDVSTILQAMHWVSAYRTQFNIRVLNLSWGVASTQSPAVDPINYAVQRLWGEGIVVVVAAGNSGPHAGTVTKPGDDPVVLTVGAFNDQGDADSANDSVPSWSSRGPTAAGLTKPDLVAPGRTIISPRSYGSMMEANYPRALMAPSYIKGSGTSQAAAVTSGLVALMLAARPELTPDEVKERLVSTASPMPGIDRFTQGRGRVQYSAAMAATPVVNPQPRLGTGLGLLDASRGTYRVVADCAGVQTEIRGEMDVRCQPWDAAAWSGLSWKDDAWTGLSWKGSEWTGLSWKGAAWSDATWTGLSWKGGTWTSDSWQGGTAWNGGSPVTSAWTGLSWKSSAWTGISWKSSDWTTGDWTTGEYDSFLSAFWGSGPPPGRYLPGERFTPLPHRPAAP